MKKTFLSACVVASAMLLFTQCKKDDSATNAPAGNFSPSTTGSSWTYKYTENSVSNTIKITATENSKIVNGKSYQILVSDFGDTTYQAKKGNDYYRLSSFPAIGINSFEELYLKDDKPVNDTWAGGTATFNFMGVNITANLADTIKGKGESRTVNGVAFNNVTHVSVGIAAFGSTIGQGNFYYQEGVGLIEDNILITPPAGASYSSKEEIVSYQIK